TSGTGHTIEVSDKVVASHGSSGTATVTWSATTSARALAVSLGLKAAPTRVTLTPATETDAAQAVTQKKTVPVTPATESDAAQTLSITHNTGQHISLTPA